jgi:NTE family protein
MTNEFSRRARALGAAALLACGAAAAAEGVRPKIGLVLGGGGARGGAHIGVLEVLEQLRIPVDCVAGTSMGALVSGAYAAGIEPGEMRESIRKTDWAGIFDDSAGRRELDLRHKELDDRFFSGLEFGVSREGLRYREGAVAGSKIKLFFNALVRSDLGERSIEELRLPLTLIATDIGTGERVAMRTGSLTSAMRASMSVPGAMAPVVRDGHKLVDGGLVDNVPIQEVRDRCGAEAVIAVNVGSPLMKPEQVTGLVSVVGQMVNLLTEQNVSRSLALLGPKDVYMRPELGSITAGSFERQLEAADIGHATALGVADSLRRYSVSAEEYAAWKARMRPAPGKYSPNIDKVEIASTRYINPETVRAGVTQKEGEPLDVQALDRDLIAINSMGELQTIDYSVLNEREKRILRITPVEKPLGPDYVRFGLNLYSDFRARATYNVRALFRQTWLNSLGGEWLAALQIGSDERLRAEFYQPLDPRQVWFIRAYVLGENVTLPVTDGTNRIAEYRARTVEAGAEAGASLETGSPVLPDVDQRVGGFRVSLALDTLDYAFFPTRGYKLDAEYFDAQRASNNASKFGKVLASVNGALTVGDLILVGAAERGTSTHGTLPVTEQFSLGGPRHLAGLMQGQLVGDNLTYYRGEVQYKLTQPIPLLGLALIAGLQAESGRIAQPAISSMSSAWQRSYGAYLAANTAIGPIYLGYSGSKTGRGHVYFFIGTP